jgi:hypothetical protein
MTTFLHTSCAAHATRGVLQCRAQAGSAPNLAAAGDTLSNLTQQNACAGP